MKKRVCLYVFGENWLEFRKICDREGVSASNKVDDFLNAYNQAHRVGNPQLLIENYVDVDKPKPVRVLCPWLDGALTSGEVHCRKKQNWVSSIECYSCKYNRLKKK